MKRYYKCNILKNFIFKHLISHVYRIYFSINLPPKEFKIEKDMKCLILAPHSDDETIGCGGLLLKYPEVFDVYCLTNGFRGIIVVMAYCSHVFVCPYNNFVYSAFLPTI